MTAVTDLLDRWVAQRGATGAATWLEERCRAVAAGAAAGERALFLAVSGAARACGRADLALDAGQRNEAAQALTLWDPSVWSVDQAARARLVLALPADDGARLVAVLDRLFAAAGLEELVALYQGLPLLPHGPLHAARAAEGVRSSMVPVFRAVALGNPYPASHLDEGAFNQLVLKAVFTGSPLGRITGLDHRANPRLSRMLCDYARERRAARRPVPDDLWPAARRGADAVTAAELATLERA